MKKPNEMTIVEAARALRARSFSVRELWDACIEAIRARDGELHAFLEVFDADERAIAAAQARIEAEGDSAPLLCGIPLAVKDNILIEGKVASAASRMLANYRATYDATVVRKLKEAGALFLGRTNMDEFAMGSSTEHSAFGPTKNPRGLSRVPGGSSGGSAAAVAADLCVAALGSDTGGSIRQPAAYCGVAGLKPTYGAVSRSGLIALGSSLDQIGPLAKSVEDARILHDAIRGKDPLDSTTIPDGLYPQRTVPNTFRIGIPDFVNRTLLHSDQPLGMLAKKLTDDGHTLVDVALPTNQYALAIYYIIMPAEASTNLARLDGIRYGCAARGKTLLDDYVLSRTEGFGEEVRRRILLGTFVLSSGYIDAYYHKAQAARSLLRTEYEKAFEKVDVIMTPTALSAAFAFGEKKDPLSMYLEDLFTVTANLTGMPAISLPIGGGGQLPVGVHFTAPHQAENLLFGIGEAVGKAQGA
ncbi:TPA: Asp-tRNA(Asn)/Glu-tRNA(Gln) amidotransferase GatCAB subunit A [Candidatus Kaiserbacteria bacterium]|nr:MAG: Glutamyl-tRNA(Gln) amidotransferase subunit A [Parcubacteria group bacterium GW2011_GWA1_56_13]KKW46901.1 MAG: Glutamyl-tRNA(Gln) amidotransferase subunit A [Parcubacteria group bacterium GW2011_GWB1_57_6]HCR52629.1 Asp-tRNA(Asn)/Glu-tRNA(Gln) amidotransferase GatCAB subunit A [Candidatus Kaiserbacteria bacterium]